jgi:Mg2+-importing ATPase
MREPTPASFDSTVSPHVAPVTSPSPALDSNGLTSDEAARRLAQYGPNEAAPVRRYSALVEWLRLFANPLVIILLVASAISASLGQRVDAGIIVTMVLLGVMVNFWQSYRSQQAADRLRSSVIPTATVMRDGRWQELALRQVVPGDLVRLSAGDLVPADAQLIESRDLSVQQSMLTGESLPADKAALTAGQRADTEGPDAAHLVFLGTSVVSGTGTAVVVATGPRTMFGDIAVRLRARAPETEFEHGLRRFSLLILRTTVLLVLFIVLVGIALKRDVFETLLFAVALGVGLTPEFLPMISSVTLTRGALRMARDGVIVKHLPAIQNFGSIDILCSDKTGTLTSGVMTYVATVDPVGGSSARALTLACLNSGFETGIKSPLDLALLQQPGIDLTAYRKVDEIPFDFERRRLSVVLAPTDGDARRLLITKGAPETMLERTSALEQSGQIVPLDADGRRRCTGVFQGLSDSGLRVLAVAYRWLDAKPAYARADETDLVLAGFVSFADHVLPDAAEMLADLSRDGVSVKILTGDNERVARHVCAAVGLGHDDIVTGDDLLHLDDAALGHVAEQSSVFVRVSPAQKDRIIVALKRRGHVVGYMGDGINDAPSLHTADVGISVMSATDVARDAADVILGQSSLRAIHKGVLEGRRASGNMMKYLLMGTSSSFGNMFSMAAASMFLPFLPMLPTQILLNSFMYDLAQLTIPGDAVDDDYLRRPQRLDMRVIRDFMVFIGPISSVFDFLTFYVLLHFLHAEPALFHTGWFMESLATQTLVLFVIRTAGNPLRSRPSRALTITTLAVVVAGVLLPFSPLAPWLGFTRLSVSYFLFLVPTTLVYLGLVEIAKRRLLRHLAPAAASR